MYQTSLRRPRKGKMMLQMIQFTEREEKAVIAHLKSHPTLPSVWSTHILAANWDDHTNVSFSDQLGPGTINVPYLYCIHVSCIQLGDDFHNIILTAQILWLSRESRVEQRHFGFSFLNEVANCGERVCRCVN